MPAHQPHQCFLRRDPGLSWLGFRQNFKCHAFRQLHPQGAFPSAPPPKPGKSTLGARLGVQVTLIASSIPRSDLQGELKYNLPFNRMPCNKCNGQFIDLHSLVWEVVFLIRFSQVYSGKLTIVSF